MSLSTYNCTTTSTTTVSCTNPVVYLFEEAKRLYDSANISSQASDVGFSAVEVTINTRNFAEILYNILNVGLILDSCNTCCPDCDEYVLASVERYMQYYENKYPLPTIPGPIGAVEKTNVDNICCRNIFTNIDPTYLDFLEFISAYPDTFSDSSRFKTCCNGFTDCLNDMIKYFSDNNCAFKEYGPISGGYAAVLDGIIEKGIVEQSTINGQSQLCTIFNLFKEYTECGCFIDVFTRILNDGLIITCDSNNRLFIGTYDRWLQYNELLNP